MNTRAKYKICRRLGQAVFEKCQTPKFVASLARHSGKKNTKKKTLSEYGGQLIEKQKVRLTYGLSEKQFSNYVKQAVSEKGTKATESLFNKLETRLDNVVYRLGFASTRALSRQMVSHGHITVNGRKVTIPSFHVSQNDVISLRESSKSKTLFTDLQKRLEGYTSPAWLSWNGEEYKGLVKGSPRDIDPSLDLNTVLEFYSR